MTLQGMIEHVTGEPVASVTVAGQTVYRRRMWIAPDGEGEPTLWRSAASFGGINAFAILQRCEIHGIGRAAVWDLITRAVEREWPKVRVDSYLRAAGERQWAYRCRSGCVYQIMYPTHAAALADALAHLASEHGGTS